VANKMSGSPLEDVDSGRRELGSPATSEAPGDANPFAPRWRELMELIAGCRSAHDANGYVVHVQQTRTRLFKGIVRGAPQSKTFASALRALAEA